ncbi:hypothetical protein EST38_g6039 [Candolleomyces aberdarensis]|uniref:DUF6534 domain-containing protein n=1 Tax=Candolleomyces aberdarensis TaxID=2316362 RepID=A0A4Q2DJ28_9AGAR|nr:hypothetical protein EST38_g6039 [Candolleomyces aberdarensis]
MAPSYLMQTGPLVGFGAYVGKIDSYFFFGAFFLQLYVYVTNFVQKDKKFFVGLVLLVTIIEVLHLVFTTHTTYSILAQGYSDLKALESSPWSGSALPVLNGLVSFCTQLFFAWRVWRLGRNTFANIASGLIFSLGLMQCAAAIAVTVQFVMIGLAVVNLQRLRQTVIVWLAGTLACDVVMTVSVIMVLMHYKRSTSYQASKNLIDAFIAHMIENGALTTICAALNLIFYLVYPNNFLYVCIEFVLGRLYANVLMATLNRRDRTRITAETDAAASGTRTKDSMTANGNPVPLSTLRRSLHSNVHNNPTGAQPKLYPIVSITREVQVDSDDTHSQKDGSDEKVGPVGVSLLP